MVYLLQLSCSTGIPATPPWFGEIPYPNGYDLLPKGRIGQCHCKMQREPPRDLNGPHGQRHHRWVGQLKALKRDGYHHTVSPRNPLARSRPKPHPYGAGRVCRNERCSGEGGSDLGRRCNTVAPHVDDLEVITLIRWRLHFFWFSAHQMFGGKAFYFRSLAAGCFSVTHD